MNIKYKVVEIVKKMATGRGQNDFITAIVE